MAGETDLQHILSHLDVETRPDTYAFVTLDAVPSQLTPDATVVEAEGVTVVVPIELARRNGWDVLFEGKWLTLQVHSSLEAVGLTAAVATAFAAEGIACNVIAGSFHDHLLVRPDRVDDAVAAIRRLRDRVSNRD